MAHACDADFASRLGWATAAYVAWVEHVDVVAHETLRIDAFDATHTWASRLEKAEMLCVLAFLNKNRKPHGCGDRRRKLADVELGKNRTRPPPLLTLKHLEEASWPSGIDGPATDQRLKSLLRQAWLRGPCAGLNNYKEVHWDLDDNMIKEGPLPPQKSSRGAHASKRRGVLGR